MIEQPKQIPQTNNQNYTTPGQMQEVMQGMASLTKLLLEVSNYLIALRREFRGEAMFQTKDGNVEWGQITKPMFIVLDYKTNQPKMEIVEMPNGDKKRCYIPNDEAIDEILSMIKFAGVNQIAPISFNQEDNYKDDMLEFECKLAAVLCLKRKTWGIDKELFPMLQFKIKTIVRDVRSMAINGNTIKSIITTVSRVEQTIENDITKKGKIGGSPYST